jgi:UDP-N-acetylglucosamine:LPS N-acetylglucosamine transferase
MTYRSARSDGLGRAYTIPNITKDRRALLRFIPWALGVLRSERPVAVVSTGAELAIPIFLIAKLLGIKTVFIESCCRVAHPSLTGRLVYPISDVFYVQWPSLLRRFGKRARYAGSLLM